jgi:hypothetical protein
MLELDGRVVKVVGVEVDVGEADFVIGTVEKLPDNPVLAESEDESDANVVVPGISV